jgi:hypothetical protein
MSSRNGAGSLPAGIWTPRPIESSLILSVNQIFWSPGPPACRAWRLAWVTPGTCAAPPGRRKSRGEWFEAEILQAPRACLDPRCNHVHAMPVQADELRVRVHLGLIPLESLTADLRNYRVARLTGMMPDGMLLRAGAANTAFTCQAESTALQWTFLRPRDAVSRSSFLRSHTALVGRDFPHRRVTAGARRCRPDDGGRRSPPGRGPAGRAWRGCCGRGS